MSAPQTRPGTQLREATVLFTDLLGFTALAEKAGVEEAYASVTGCLKLLDEVARRHGGSVDKYLGDSIMAVFGFPVVREDSARAALEAATEMHHCVQEYNREHRLDPPLGIHTGINTGTVLFGSVAGPVIREFHVLGDSVNIAARLKEKAPNGGVYLGESTYAPTRDRFRFQPLKPLPLKGKSVSVMTYALRLPDEASARRQDEDGHHAQARLTGRERELSLLGDALEGLAAGRGGLLTLCGAPGLGKSRLLTELANHTDGSAVQWHQVLCLRSASQAPYEPLAEFVRRWAGIAADTPPQQVRERLRTALASLQSQDANALLPGLWTLLVRFGPDHQRLRGQQDPEAQAREIRTALAGLLEALGRQKPLLLAFEDLHRADRETLALLASLLPVLEESAVLLVSSFRPGHEAKLGALLEPARGATALRYTEIVLAPLDSAASRALVLDVLGREDIADESFAAIRATAQGNPSKLIQAAFLAPALQREGAAAEADTQRSSDVERRRTTVLFADITGFTAMTEKLDAAATYERVTECLALLDDTARKHGGTVEKHLGDCVLALFGVPVAIEDAPRAAVNAAIEMRRRVREYNDRRQLDKPLDVHIGIDTGLGISGDISGPLLREFAVMGDSVNLASYLTDEAEAGHIFVGPATHRATKHAFEFKALDPMVLAGRKEPVQAYELLSEQTRLHREATGVAGAIFSELVGRDEELAQLRAGFAAVTEGRGGTISLIAEAGLGKSRLITEMMESPEAQATAVYFARSLSVGQNLSFHPFADLFRAWARITDEDDEAGALKKVSTAVARLLPEEHDDVFPFIATLIGIKREGDASATAPTGEALEKVILQAVTQVLRRMAAETPLVLVFEDLHWADLSSIELLEALLRLGEKERILFVNVCRPGFTATSAHICSVLREQHAERSRELVLAPLGDAAVKKLIANLFQKADVPLTTRTMIRERAAGNPLYVEEVVRSLLDEGAVAFVDGELRATDRMASVEIPGTVQEVVMARVDRRPLRERHLLQVASVIGQTFHFEVLAEVLGDKDQAETDLGRLEEAGFLVPWDRYQEREYGFKHPLIQEVTYDSLVRVRREELHRQVGTAIGLHLTENTPGFYAMLAYHFSRGRDLERAEEYLALAGQEAARSAASNEALYFFQEASKLYFDMHGEGGDPRQKAMLKQNVGLALFNRGQLIEAVAHFTEALDYLGARLPKSKWAQRAHFPLDLLIVLARLYAQRPHGRRRQSTPEQLEVLRVMFKRAMSQTMTDPERFVFDALGGMRIMLRLDPASLPEAGPYYAAGAAIFSYGGLSLAVGRRFLDAAHQLHEQGLIGELVIYYRFMEFVHHFLAGDWSKEHEIEDSVLQENLLRGHLFDVTTYLGLHTEQLIRRGDFTGARARIAEIDRIWDLYQFDVAKTNHYAQPLFLLMEQGRLDEALVAADEYYDENPEDLLHILALSAKAEICVQRGELDTAEEILQKALRIVDRNQPVTPYHLSSYRAARYALDVALVEDTRRSGKRLGHKLRRQAHRSGAAARRIVPKNALRGPMVYRLSARHAWLLGRRKAALKWWKTALDAANRLGMRPELGRISADAGATLSKDPRGGRELAGRDPRAHREEARAIFQELGLEVELARLDSLERDLA